jgi:hypothetical protein
MSRPPQQTVNASGSASDAAISVDKRTHQGGLQRKPQKNPAQASSLGTRAAENLGVPDAKQLVLVATRLYVDRSTGTFWLQLLSDRSF